jgi:5-formyltetrahydrofolate cyclo-ligase
MSASTDDIAALRATLRARRRKIRGAARQQLSNQIARHIANRYWLKAGRNIGLYLALKDEVDSRPLLRLARERGCTLAAPRITDPRHGRMRFVQLEGTVQRGAFGISEPRGTQEFPARMLDIVFVPLVGFDTQGYRLGMGKGFYDRFFQHRLRMQYWRRPLLIGIAYDVQQVPMLPHAAHDVPLDAIVTQSTVLTFGRRRGS